MNTADRSFLPRTARVSLVAGLVLPCLGVVADLLTTHSDVCEEYDRNGMLFVDVPNLGLAFAWLGAISSLVSLAGTAMWLVAKLRHPDGVSRWIVSGWFFFLLVPLIPLLINIADLSLHYADAVGRIMECI
ncbi:MAG TPA: hypothetical protein VF444_17155 [Pseudonocardiaceae bacterium]